jgi:hypothetical protein
MPEAANPSFSLQIIRGFGLLRGICSFRLTRTSMSWTIDSAALDLAGATGAGPLLPCILLPGLLLSCP